MEKSEYRKHFELENGYWWFRARRAVSFRILKRAIRGRGPFRILDAGCGTGINLTRLAGLGMAFGCDIAAEALSFCRDRGLGRLTRADVNRIPYGDERFDLVTLFDVLYHKAVSDDVEVLREVRRVLRPGGFLLLTDSAFESLRGPHDEVMQGARRNTRKTLGEKLDRAGLEVDRMTYFFAATFPTLWLKRRNERGQAARHPGAVPRSDLMPLPRWINGLLSGVFGLEARLAARRSLPWGSSIVVLARKK
jgi:SAM-dependent methyltransferase